MLAPFAIHDNAAIPPFPTIALSGIDCMTEVPHKSEILFPFMVPFMAPRIPLKDSSVPSAAQWTVPSVPSAVQWAVRSAW